MNEGTPSAVIYLKDQAETLRLARLRKKRKTYNTRRPVRILSFTSGKGGVGKTFATVNTAIGLCQLGKEVAILDADLGLANIDLMLGLKSSYTLESVLCGEREIDEIVVEGPYGIKILPAATGLDDITTLSSYQKIMLVDAIERSTLSIDYLLIDTSAGIGENVLFFNAASTEVVCVITPDVTSLTDAYALIKLMAKRYKEQSISIVVNNVVGSGEVVEKTAYAIYQRLAESLDRFLHIRTNYLGFIPADILASTALEGQRALIGLYPASSGGRALTRLAKRIDEEHIHKKVKGGVQFFFQNLLTT